MQRFSLSRLLRLLTLLSLAYALFGGVWFAVIAALVVVAAVALGKRPLRGALGPLFATPEESKGLLRRLMLRDGRLAERLRLQQVIRESLDLALSSQDRDTAESRMQLAERLLAELKEGYAAVIPAAELNNLEAAFDSARRLFKARKYVDETSGLPEQNALPLATEDAAQDDTVWHLFSCPDCGRSYQVKTPSGERSYRCAGCRRVFRVGGPEAPGRE
jgi:hypothetical protein